MPSFSATILFVSTTHVCLYSAIKLNRKRAEWWVLSCSFGEVGILSHVFGEKRIPGFQTYNTTNIVTKVLKLLHVFRQLVFRFLIKIKQKFMYFLSEGNGTWINLVLQHYTHVDVLIFCSTEMWSLVAVIKLSFYGSKFHLRLMPRAASFCFSSKCVVGHLGCGVKGGQMWCYPRDSNVCFLATETVNHNQFNFMGCWAWEKECSD